MLLVGVVDGHGNDEVKAPVPVLFGRSDVIAHVQHLDVVLHAEHARDLVNILDKRADHAHARDVVQVVADGFARQGQPLAHQLFGDAPGLFQAGLDALNGRALFQHAEFLVEDLEARLQRAHRGAVAEHQLFE